MSAVRECGKKQKFYSEKEARVHLHHMKQWKKTRNKDALNVYRCNFCELYHIGHLPKWVENNIKRIAKDTK